MHKQQGDSELNLFIEKGLYLAAFGLTALLSACGGGGGDSAPATPPLPSAIAAQDDAQSAAWSNGASRSTTVDVLANDGAPADAVVTVTTQPQHGKAVVEGGKVQYTPTDGYVGADSFAYRVEAGARTGSATARLTVEASFTLSGVVVPQLAAGYTVSAQAGAASAVQTQPTADRYSLTVKTSDLSGMVTMTATGAGEQGHVVMRSIVGEVASLAKLGGTIDEQRRPALRLDVFSVARDGLLKRAGAQPASDAALVDANKRVSEFELLSMIGGLRNSIADRTLLPAKFPSVADIAADPVALAQAVQAAKSKDATPRDWGYETSLKAQPAPAAVIGPQGGRFAFIDGHKPTRGYEGLTLNRPNASRDFDLRSDGTVGWWPGSDPIGTWARDGSKVTIKLNPGLGLTFGTYPTSVGSATRNVTQYELEELPRAGASGQPMFNLTVFFTETRCSTMQRTCGSDGSVGRLIALVAGFDLARDVLPFLPSHFAAGGRLFGLAPQTSPEAETGRCLTCAGEGITLTGSPSVLGQTGVITEDGRWKLSGANVSTRYTRLLRWGNGIETLFAEYEANGKVIGVELIEATGTGATPTVVAEDMKLRRFLSMPAGSPYPFDWNSKQTLDLYIGAYAVDVKTSGPPAPTAGGAEGPWGWSSDGTTVLHSSGRIKLRLISKTRDGYIATYLQDNFPGELRVLTDLGPVP